MRNKIIKIILLTGVLIMFLECVYVFGSFQDRGAITTKVRRLPAPELPAL